LGKKSPNGKIRPRGIVHYDSNRISSNSIRLSAVVYDGKNLSGGSLFRRNHTEAVLNVLLCERKELII